ncbi:hypothetical protein PMAYCL1PPCAC_03987 [Pristionchus mayeri]|uniref:Uncharacterized protein n=1 Tax=Pristionchus mayeri TaxID=1317129 RepID=A0AAN4Z9I8_9BILA|nr:hypothetical protein PMAYCL1PPCAC_03987 [Pristionchus mayeri]
MRAVLLFLLMGVAYGTHVNFNNRCNQKLHVNRTENGQGPTQQAYLSSGQVAGKHDYKMQFILKDGWNGRTLAEFSFNSSNGVDFYDPTLGVGYDTPMQISTDLPSSST